MHLIVPLRIQTGGYLFFKNLIFIYVYFLIRFHTLYFINLKKNKTDGVPMFNNLLSSVSERLDLFIHSLRGETTISIKLCA